MTHTFVYKQRDTHICDARETRKFAVIMADKHSLYYSEGHIGLLI